MKLSRRRPQSNSLLYEVYQGYGLPAPVFDISDLGKNSILDYRQYGDFKGKGSPEYQYVIRDTAQLKKDIGAGIYPNQAAVKGEEGYKKYNQEGLLKGYHWDALKDGDLQKAFYMWAEAEESEGVKLFFIGAILEKAGHILPAIKAYYAALVHFPTATCWASDKSFVWYIGPEAIKSIERLSRDYPDLDLELVGATVKMEKTQT